jgi:hypothetical protein
MGSTLPQADKGLETRRYLELVNTYLVVAHIKGEVGAGMLTTGNQLKAARALIGMDQSDLAERAKVNVNTIRNMEAAGLGPIAGRSVNVQAVQRALEGAGVEFTNGDQPGVKMKRKE